MRKKACLTVAATAALFVGCQDYGFEELPSSVIRERREKTSITLSTAVDILFVIDNSGSMVGEQHQLGQSFGLFIAEIEKYFGTDYQIAVITSSVKSPQCPDCPQSPSTCPTCNINPTSPQCCAVSPTSENCAECSNCMNVETGESGAFQTRLGHNEGTIDDPHYVFTQDPNCGQIITTRNKSCFFDTATEKGIALVGTNGCGYEKGLEAIRMALDDQMKPGGKNDSNFLRPNASLAVIVVSDEEDCGKVGETTEGISGIGGTICYYAANGADHNNNPNDPTGKPYRLTPESHYYDFLIGLKGGRKSMVKFAAIVGISDPDNPLATKLEFEADGKVKHACTTPGCSGRFCFAEPGTRYIKLASMFGDNGKLATICQGDFSETLKEIGEWIGCPDHFDLSEPILDPGLANILVNDTTVPRYSCAVPQGDKRLIPCKGTSDTTSCPTGLSCVETWTYQPPNGSGARGGSIWFASHYNPCDYFSPGETVEIELVYVTP